MDKKYAHPCESFYDVKKKKETKINNVRSLLHMFHLYCDTETNKMQMEKQVETF